MSVLSDCSCIYFSLYLGGGSVRSEGAQYLCVDLKAGADTIDTVLQRGRPLSADQDNAVARDEHTQDSIGEQ